ncbi:MAG: sensor histidine kinase, partial [Candidatus Levybacteria bacterium]|nr:sensor histidine kinase [Candidatus Levybacteria bacterium]
MDNAAKYSDPESVIILETIIEKKYLMIAVRDEGQGISESDLPQIFDDFYKGENNIKSGLGLGLFIIKKIVNEHKGKISV